MRRIPIFFTFDRNYVNQAAVAFWSLLNRTRGDAFWEMWVLHHDLTEENRALLGGIVSKSGKGALKFLDTGDFLKDEWKSGSWEGHQTRSQFTVDTVVRCFGARFFPQYDRIIYSDVDVVFMDDVSELGGMDVADVYCAGVLGFKKYDRINMGHLKPEHYEMLKDSYLAGGIWVMNLKKIRADGLETRMLEIVRDDTIVKRWNDQDVMNIACAGKVKFLPLNYISYTYLHECLRDGPFESPFTRDELFDSIINPKILHYAARKPWKTSVERGEIWWYIADYLGLDVARPGAGGPSGREEDELGRLKKAKRRYRLVALVATLVALVSAAALIAALLSRG